MMNDNEIIKALECCTQNDTLDVYRNDCDICPLNECNSENCVYITQIEALDLIKRQQKEIERLKDENKHHRKTIAENERRALDVTLEEIEKSRTEAIKEFAERVKYEFCPDCDYSTDDIWAEIDYRAKEMIEKGDEEK